MAFVDPEMFRKSGLEKEIDNLMRQMTVHGKGYSLNPKLPPIFSIKCEDVFKQDLLDMATTRYRKKENKTVFVPTPGTIIIPKICKNKVTFHLKKLRF